MATLARCRCSTPTRANAPDGDGGPHLTGLAATPDGHYLALASSDPDTALYAVDLFANAMGKDAEVPHLSVPSGVLALATGAEISRAYATTGDGHLLYWDLDSNTIAQNIAVGHNPTGLTLGLVEPVGSSVVTDGGPEGGVGAATGGGAPPARQRHRATGGDSHSGTTGTAATRQRHGAAHRHRHRHDRYRYRAQARRAPARPAQVPAPRTAGTTGTSPATRAPPQARAQLAPPATSPDTSSTTSPARHRAAPAPAATTCHRRALALAPPLARGTTATSPGTTSHGTTTGADRHRQHHDQYGHVEPHPTNNHEQRPRSPGHDEYEPRYQCPWHWQHYRAAPRRHNQHLTSLRRRPASASADQAPRGVQHRPASASADQARRQALARPASADQAPRQAPARPAPAGQASDRHGPNRRRWHRLVAGIDAGGWRRWHGTRQLVSVVQAPAPPVRARATSPGIGGAPYGGYGAPSGTGVGGDGMSGVSGTGP